MKKILLLSMALSVIMFTGCKKQITTPQPDPVVGSSDRMIYLGAGGPALVKAANIGVRDTLFLAGDQIGVIAALSTTTDVDNPTNIADWAKAVYFDNAPAAFSHVGEIGVGTGDDKYMDQRSYFNWGPAGEGGLTHSRFYPAQDKPIMVYAYYPYSTTDYVKPDGTTTKPTLKVTLNTDVTRLSATPVEGANLNQADVLWFAPVEEVKRTDTLTAMGFKHALSQLTFRFKRPEGATVAYIDSVIFETLASATMNITDGTFTFPSPAGGSDPDPLYTAAKYIILANPKHRAVPVVKKGDGNDNSLDIFKDVSPLMIFPLSADNAKLGRLRIVYNISPKGDQVGEDYVKSSVISLSTLKDAFVAGKKNFFTISISSTGINLEAKIAPWDSKGSDSDLEAE